MQTKARIPTGRYPRGEETKQRIIAVAIAIFGRQGFAGTSTRDIAAAANVKTPAIQYYFGSKFGLYHACIDQLTVGVWRRIGPAVQSCQSTLETATLDGLIQALGEVQDCMIDAFFADAEGQAIRRLMAWEDAENGETASDLFMKNRIGLPLFETFRNVVERVVAASVPRIEIDMHALSLMGLSMILHVNQTRVMDLLNWSTLDTSLLDTLKAVTRKQLSNALVGLSDTTPVQAVRT